MKQTLIAFFSASGVTRHAAEQLAAAASGEFASAGGAAAKIVKVTETIEPEPELVAKYEEKYRKFAKIYPTVKDLFSELL